MRDSQTRADISGSATFNGGGPANRAPRKRRGAVLIYALAGMITFILITSLAVDWGRIQLHKTELANAADASAMAGASIVYNGAVYARAEARKIASMNKAAGKGVNVLDGDVRVGKWDTARLTLDPASATPDAVEVTTYMTRSRQNPIPLMFMPLFSQTFTTAEATKQTTARWVRTGGIFQNISARANPFLSNAPKGASASAVNPSPRGADRVDYAGDQDDSNDESKRKNSPMPAGDSLGRLPVSKDMRFTFDSIKGNANHDPNDAKYAPDGKLTDIGHNNNTTTFSNNYTKNYSDLKHENGIHDMIAPINALVGVFLSDEDPSKTAVPSIPDRYNADAPWDYTNAAERNRTTYKPALKQIFFIGDGVTDNNIPQTWVAPPGATRLYLATWDFYEWNNNDGFREVRINSTGKVEIVK